jgi:hypothetical protein
VVVGSKFTGSGSFLERALGTILRDDKSTSPHQLVSMVVLVRTPRVLVLSFGIYWRDLLPIQMKLAPADADIVFICCFGLYYHVFIIYYLFCLFLVIYLFILF